MSRSDEATPLIGNDPARAAFARAAASGNLHHAWLIAGPKGVGKATFARAAALDLLAAAAAGRTDATRSLIEAGSHPDYRLLTRLPKDADKPGEDLARSITIAQVRSLGPMFATRPSMGPRRVIVIDAIDDLESGGANALLKSLEEPPAGTIFLLVSHAPGQLLPTIRSRCRLLRFESLADDQVAQVLRARSPEATADEIAALVHASGGAPGRGLRYAGLDIAGIDAALRALVAHGDASNTRRGALAKQLGGKAAQPRYDAFLDRSTAFLADIARDATGARRLAALDAYATTRDLAGAARGLSLDPAATVFEIGGIIAALNTA